MVVHSQTKNQEIRGHHHGAGSAQWMAGRLTTDPSAVAAGTRPTRKRRTIESDTDRREIEEIVVGTFFGFPKHMVICLLFTAVVFSHHYLT